MAKFTYSVALDSSSGYAWEEAYLRVKVSRVDADGSQTHVATYEMRWHESTDSAKGDHTHLMSVTTLYASSREMHGASDLMLMALTMNEISDAFTAEHELYDQVFSDAEGEDRNLVFSVDSDA